MGERLNNKKILVIDDDIQLINTIRKMLENTVFHVDFASDYQQALSILQVTTYDGILLDYLLQGNRGIEFVKGRSWAKDKTKLILVMGHVTHAKIRDFFLEGVNGYLLKPFNKEDLVGTLNVHLDVSMSGDEKLGVRCVEEKGS